MYKEVEKTAFFAKKKILSKTAILTAFSLLISVLCLLSAEKHTVKVNADAHFAPTVILDAGHGGFDGGAVAADGTAEKGINLSIALNLSDMLKVGGYDVIMTRTSDTGTEDDETENIRNRKVSDLKNRLKLMEEHPDAIFVSIHLNKFAASSVNGAQVFYSENHEGSKLLGQSIQDNFKVLLQPENDRVIKRATKSTYLLFNAKIPAVIVECGFLSNSRELELLKTEDYQKKAAFAIFGGINDYYTSR